MKDQKKIGIILSYINTALGMMINIVLTPMIITALSDDMYSIYKVMQSFAGPLIMFNLGLSTIVARAVAKCRGSAEDIREKQNTFAMAIVVSWIMAAVVVAVGLVMCTLVPTIYSGNYTPEQLAVAQKVLFIFVVSTAVIIMADTLKGCVTGREQFVFQYGVRAMQYVLKFLLVLFFVHIGCSVVQIALVDLLCNVTVLLCDLVYCFVVLKERPRLHQWDKKELLLIASFSGAILLQAIVNQVNNNVDLMILGAVEPDKEIITMYSAALTIYGVYNSLISVFSSVYFPQATKLVTRGASGKELTDFVVAPGRLQAALAVGILGAFGLFGGHFISIWIGEQYKAAHLVTMILLIPVTIPLVQNVCIAILDAKLKRTFRSVTLVIMAALNVLLTLVLIRFIGFWGAAVATALSLTIGHGIIMNVYYQKVIGFEVVRMFKGIFKGILPSGIVAVAVCSPLAVFLGDSVFLFIVKGTAFVAVYGLLLWKWGFNEQDKGFIIKRKGE